VTKSDLIIAATARIRNLVIRHPQFDVAYNTIVHAYELNCRAGIAQGICLFGESGTGKSTVKKIFEEEFPPRFEDNRKIAPVLVVDTPSLPTVKNLAEAILFQLGDPLFAKGSAIEKTARILCYFQAFQTKLLIIDELQHFIDQGNRRMPIEVSDWLKSLIERANISAVLMGLDRSEFILQINEQLRRRFSRRLELTPFGLEDVIERGIFIGVLKNLEEALDLPIKMDLRQEQLVRSFHHATNGIVDYMVKLLIGAYEIAVNNNCKSIKLDNLEYAFTERIWINGVGNLNPFNEKFILQRLDKRGMPFFKTGMVKKDI
jgi:hypothetical protein